MNPVGKALWFIESHFAQEVSLDEIAGVAGVSRFHLSRVFAIAIGQSLIRYLRGRRLSEAARSLAKGAPDILSVALDAGYGSHEACTRAFRDHFGLTPEEVRAQRCLDNLLLVEPIAMDRTLLTTLESPRFETSKPLLIAGLSERYHWKRNEGILAQWQRFHPYEGNIPGQVGTAAYGVCCNSDDEGNFDYLCGVEVADFSDLPAELGRIRIPAQTYAVFTHREHITSIRSVFYTIWNQWLPGSGHEVADAPVFERYGEKFDGAAGKGGFEIWVPIKA